MPRSIPVFIPGDPACKCKSDEEKTKIVDHVKTIFASRPDVQALTIDGIRVQMDYGWGLIRASNTQPAIVLRLEADSPERLHEYRSWFERLLADFRGDGQ